jgi:hypothetical protein
MEREPVDWQNRSSRRGVSLVGTARLSNGIRFRLLITNLSYEGCTAIGEQPLQVGESLSLLIPDRGTIDAQVRWTADEKVGIRFLLGNSPVEERRARLGF